MSKKLSDIKTNFPEWYNDVVYDAQLADQSPVRGCMVIRPYGYAIWENIVAIVDKRIKETGHQNVAFPLLIPQSFIEREAKHVEGFAPELAVVTHAGGKALEEPLVIRPTSETIIYYMFAKWIRSWRDLPLKVNQWANVMRWEMRTRPFLRTSEFFWQEGHTAHETEQEADDEATMMLREYVHLSNHYLAIPAISGVKSESERFAGADKTYTIEGLMQDGKALQMGTSHLLSRNFAKSFEMTFQTRDGQLDYPYLTSWAVTTRLIGALVMVHGDQKGLVIPPRIAPIQVVIIPIFKKDIENHVLLKAVQEITEALSPSIRVHVDADEHETPGAKFYKWELKGVPVRIEIGPRDIANGVAVVSDRLGLAKEVIPFKEILVAVQGRLELVQHEMYKRAQERMKAQWHKAEKLAVFGKALEADGGLYQTGWCNSGVCEAKLKEYKATVRCLLNERSFDECFACNAKSVTDILVAKSY